MKLSLAPWPVNFIMAVTVEEQQIVIRCRACHHYGVYFQHIAIHET
ncbi:MAG: hypothetical protein KKD28_06725 [Chloroflexi bacterium]|nr:hypothetical protein [Chloroflexota bacterium]